MTEQRKRGGVSETQIYKHNRKRIKLYAFKRLRKMRNQKHISIEKLKRKERSREREDMRNGDWEMGLKLKRFWWRTTLVVCVRSVNTKIDLWGWRPEAETVVDCVQREFEIEMVRHREICEKENGEIIVRERLWDLTVKRTTEDSLWTLGLKISMVKMVIHTQVFRPIENELRLLIFFVLF